MSRFSLPEAVPTIFAPHQFPGYIPGAVAGNYTMTLQASSTSGTKNYPLTLKIRPGGETNCSIGDEFNVNGLSGVKLDGGER